MLRALLAVLALWLAAGAAGAAAPRLTLDATVDWQEPGADFGGFSGLVVTDGGTRFLAVSDRGHWVRGRLVREAGRLIAARLEASGPLLGVNGAPLGGIDTNAEALVLDRRGRAWIAFEAFHRVRRYDRIDGPASSVPSHPDFPRLQDNSGLEALAIDASGTVYAIPERSGALDRPFPVYRFDGRRWTRQGGIRRDGAFLVVDAAFGPDGDLYVLERDFGWLSGFATRIRRFTPGPAGFGGEVTLLETGFTELDNMEGISVWRDPQGRTRITLISDDNFFPLQKTMFAEYVLSGS